ncbi:hypothetical protein GOBAR_AA14871 [Gossypium barbadense]|uniref:Dicer-like protein 4 n=1 Tax=Gossypium barbadense TaxID=3634 RepID=A0A2P5XQZ5_GOSBA|nr:hypothetical protein GOBAR_AA14871 [Gossypium barbadense]
MPDGELSTDGTELSMASKVKAFSTPSPIVEISRKDEPIMEKKEKDPRKIARKYQLELCKKAMEENIIVYLETGCGKTHIAVLLIYELGHLIRKPQNRVCIFLAPTVALVQQQARVIEDSLDFKVGTYCGNCRHLKNHHDWEIEIKEYEVIVLVMTPQILLRSLYHCFIRVDLIALLIFDECHHAQIKSNHPYAEIMKVFYDKATASMLPRIFGMTASPVVGKDASSQVNLPKSINSLENLLDAKGAKFNLNAYMMNKTPKQHFMYVMGRCLVYSVGDKEELESFVASPVVRVYDYGPVNFGSSCSTMIYCSKLEEIKRQCIPLVRKNGDIQSARNTKKLLNRMHDNIIFCLENLGIWGALQACRLLLTGNNSERNELIEDEGILSDDSVCDRYLVHAADVFASDCTRDGPANDLSDVEILKEPFFSKKLLRLVGILSTFRQAIGSWFNQFGWQLNLLIATKVGEEGLDIQTCCLVIRFDLPETVASFIQSRGRARMPLSEYAFLVNSGNEKELDLIKNFKKDEDRMNVEISFRTSTEVSIGLEERIYTVDSSGASISSGYSISLLHHYCSKLPHDEYFFPKPSFYYSEDSGGTICNIILPSNAPINQIASTPQSSVNAAKKDACLKAIEELHKLGALTDHLLPLQNSVLEEETLLVSSDSGSSEADEDSRGELHEMLVPAVLKESWTNLENCVLLYAYYIKFIPNPEDRSYKEFALFVKSPLPKEAERMELDLHLSRRRSVMTKLTPSGVAEFKREEIMQAQHFQEMFFKVILDRSELLSEFVTLGNVFLSSSSSTFYLLLPVILSNCENKVTVDWGIVQRCLSSPLFKSPVAAAKIENFPSDVCLHLVNGCRSIRDIENSLVSGIHLKYPEQPLLHAKPLFKLHNLLHNRKPEDSESNELEEYFIDLPPELCQLKIIGFSKEIGSSLSLLPSIMHRLENLLVAIELKHVLEALTTEKCQERFSLERLESLGDSFLKFAVARHLFLLHDALDEGELTRRRSNVVNNSNLFKLATRRNLQEAFIVVDRGFQSGKAAFLRWIGIRVGLPRVCLRYQAIVASFRFLIGMVEGCYPQALGDLVESCFGAILLDTGFNLNRVWKIMLSILDPIKSLSSVQLNPIREVQELSQCYNWDLQFLVAKVGRNFSVDAKALGYAPKSKSLDEVLKGSPKNEAKLIGYDETPIDVTVPDIIGFENMKLQESLVNDFNPKTRSSKKTTSSGVSCISPGSRPFEVKAARGSASGIEPKGTPPNCSIVDPSCGIDSPSKGESHSRTARSQLYEICAINCWKPPLFECCKEEGPSHLRSFTYRVIVEIEEAPDMILECFSSPRTTKKAAAEHAAEGALWYLKHEGYLQ